MRRLLGLAVLAVALFVPSPVAGATYDYQLKPTPWHDAWGCHGVQLWNGSQLLKTIGPYEPSDGLRPCAAVSYQMIGYAPGWFVFAWSGGPKGTLVFGSTGTPEGTKLLWRGDGSLGPGPYFDLMWCERCHEYVLAMQFLVSGGFKGGIITTAGTPESTRVLRGRNPGAGWKADGLSLPLFVPVGEGAGPVGQVYVAGDSAHGRELWFSDGTRDGSHLIMDIRPGPKPSEIRGLEVGVVYPSTSWVTFTADDGHGRARWFSKGTPETTYKVTS